MNEYGVNREGINGRGSRARLVSLGDCSIALGFTVFERALTLLSGTITFDTTTYGDLSKLVNLSAADAGIAFEATGTLDGYSSVQIPAGSAGISWDATGTLYAGILLGSASTGVDFVTTGSLTVLQRLSGSTGIDFTLNDSGLYVFGDLGSVSTGLDFATSGDLTQHVLRYLPLGQVDVEFDVTGDLTQYVLNYLPSGTAPFVFDASGDLTQYHPVLMSGSTGMVMDATGSLTLYVNSLAGSTGVDFGVTGGLNRFAAISGTATMTFSVTGSLFNNPTAADPAAQVMYRPAVDRVMVRQ